METVVALPRVAVQPPVALSRPVTRARGRRLELLAGRAVVGQGREVDRVGCALLGGAGPGEVVEVGCDVAGAGAVG